MRAFDQDARVAAVDGQLVCDEVFHAPGVASRILDVESGDSLLDLGETVVYAAARIAEGEDQSDAIVVDVAAHNADSKAVAISDSGMIATGSSADGVRVWSPDGELVASLPTHQDDAPTFAFAPGTDTLYYEDGDGVVRRFAIDVDDVTRLARSVLTREFTPQECARYFPDEPCPRIGA